MVFKKLALPVLISAAVLAGLVVGPNHARSKAGAEPAVERLVTRTMPPSDPGPKKPRWTPLQPFI
jgi:hypothetical protein